MGAGFIGYYYGVRTCHGYPKPHALRHLSYTAAWVIWQADAPCMIMNNPAANINFLRQSGDMEVVDSSGWSTL